MELGKAIETIEILDTAAWIAPEEVEALTTLTEHARRSLDAPVGIALDAPVGIDGTTRDIILGALVDVTVDELVTVTHAEELSRQLAAALESRGHRFTTSMPASAQEPPARSNLDDAIEITAEIDRIRGVVAELKSAFARRELDGGAKAAYDHPLYIEAQARLAELHEQLMMVI